MNAEHVVDVQSRQEVSDYIYKSAASKIPLCVYRTTTPPGGLRLNLQKINRLIEIDSDNLVATVEPGLVMGELAEELARKGLRFLPADAPYYRHLSVGEWAYQGCPNASSWKYGLGKHTLMGSTYIIPSGKSIKLGGKTVKNVTGYDFTRFLAGAYSDIGIGVEFLLKLLPQPECRMRFLVGFPSLQQAFGFINDLRQNPIAPAFLMAADAKTLSLRLGITTAPPILLEFELDGVTQEVEAFADDIHRWAEKHQAISLSSSNSEDITAQTGLGTIFSAQTASIICDEWKIPYDKQLSAIQKLTKDHSNIGWFGQWAEGKLHAAFTNKEPNILDISKTIVNAGGVSSGVYERQHGNIPNGPLKPLEIALRKSIDPQGIFTPKEVLA